VARLALALVLSIAASLSWAQPFPAKPVRFIVPFQPAGPSDVVARLVGARLTQAWGQQVVVENRAGASGNLGAQTVARAAPDGYTLLVTTSSIAVNATLSARPGYDLIKDLAPVINIASSPNAIVANAAWGPSTLHEAIERARTSKVAYGSPGAGTTPHLSAEYLFRVLAKLDVVHVPYKGGAPVAAAVAAGEVQLASAALPSVMPFIRSGRVVALAVTSMQRVPNIPGVPTVAEAGYPGFADDTWVGLFAPAGTPPALVARINAEIAKMLAAPDVRDRISAAGFEPVGGSADDFAGYVKDEVDRWAKIVRATGAKED
jgi:tripartite-type tricarboxylate transporter receptor subunit TctC